MSYRTLLKIKKLSPHAMLPTRGSENAAGYDLYAAFDKVGDSVVLYPGQRRAIKTSLVSSISTIAERSWSPFSTRGISR